MKNNEKPSSPRPSLIIGVAFAGCLGVFTLVHWLNKPSTRGSIVEDGTFLEEARQATTSSVIVPHRRVKAELEPDTGAGLSLNTNQELQLSTNWQHNGNDSELSEVDRAAIGELSNKMREGNIDAVTELSKYGKHGVYPLIDGLSHERFNVRLSCLNMLLSLHDEAFPAAEYASDLLFAQESALRKRASELFGRFASSEASRRNLSALRDISQHDAYENVRDAAEAAVRAIEREYEQP